MFNQELNIHTHTNNDGIAHLDIPVGIADQDIVVSISYSIAEPENQRQPNNTDHLLGSFNSADTRHLHPLENETAFGQAVIEKLSDQGVQLP